MGGRGRRERDAEAPGEREARGEGDADGARAGDGDLRTALPGDLCEGGATVRDRGAGAGARCTALGEIRSGDQRQWLHAVLPGAEDRRVRRESAELARGSL